MRVVASHFEGCRSRRGLGAAGAALLANLSYEQGKAVRRDPEKLKLA